MHCNHPLTTTPALHCNHPLATITCIECHHDAQLDVGRALVVGVGHSFGAASLLSAELARPGTFKHVRTIQSTHAIFPFTARLLTDGMQIVAIEPIVFEAPAQSTAGNVMSVVARRRRLVPNTTFRCATTNTLLSAHTACCLNDVCAGARSRHSTRCGEAWKSNPCSHPSIPVHSTSLSTVPI